MASPFGVDSDLRLVDDLSQASLQRSSADLLDQGVASLGDRDDQERRSVGLTTLSDDVSTDKINDDVRVDAEGPEVVPPLHTLRQHAKTKVDFGLLRDHVRESLGDVSDDVVAAYDEYLNTLISDQDRQVGDDETIIEMTTQNQRIVPPYPIIPWGSNLGLSAEDAQSVLLSARFKQALLKLQARRLRISTIVYLKSRMSIKVIKARMARRFWSAFIWEHPRDSRALLPIIVSSLRILVDSPNGIPTMVQNSSRLILTNSVSKCACNVRLLCLGIRSRMVAQSVQTESFFVVFALHSQIPIW